MIVTVIGRGHSGTRAIAETLGRSGVYLGEQRNESWDTMPPYLMYEAARRAGKKVKYLSDYSWDFSDLMGDMDEAAQLMISLYVGDVVGSKAARAGWKLPETLLCFPWVARLFPDIHYIHWVRHPLDTILAHHGTDHLADWLVEAPETENMMAMRAWSWLYQHKLVETSRQPKHWLTVRLEDFIREQPGSLARLSEYLGFPLVEVEVRPEVVERYLRDDSWRGVPAGLLAELEAAAEKMRYGWPD